MDDETTISYRFWRKHRKTILTGAGLVAFGAICYHKGNVSGQWEGMQKLGIAIGMQAPDIAKKLDANYAIRVNMPKW